MKLKTFTPETTGQVKTGKGIIRLNRKTGLIGFSVIATQAIGLQEGDRIVFSQDELYPADWYVSKTTKEEGYTVRIKDGAAAFNNAGLANIILDSVGQFKGVSYVVSKEPIDIDGDKFYAIITANPLNPK